MVSNKKRRSAFSATTEVISPFFLLSRHFSKLLFLTLTMEDISVSAPSVHAPAPSSEISSSAHEPVPSSEISSSAFAHAPAKPDDATVRFELNKVVERANKLLFTLPRDALGMTNEQVSDRRRKLNIAIRDCEDLLVDTRKMSKKRAAIAEALYTEFNKEF